MSAADGATRSAVSPSVAASCCVLASRDVLLFAGLVTAAPRAAGPSQSSAAPIVPLSIGIDGGGATAEAPDGSHRPATSSGSSTPACVSATHIATTSGAIDAARASQDGPAASAVRGTSSATAATSADASQTSERCQTDDNPAHSSRTVIDRKRRAPGRGWRASGLSDRAGRVASPRLRDDVNDEVFRRIVGRRARPPLGEPPPAAAREAHAEMARYRTRAPKGVFRYASHEAANLDRERWTVDAMVALEGTTDVPR